MASTHSLKAIWLQPTGPNTFAVGSPGRWRSRRPSSPTCLHFHHHRAFPGLPTALDSYPSHHTARSKPYQGRDEEGEEATTAPIFQMRKLKLRLVRTIPKQGLKPTEPLAPQPEVNFRPETPSLKRQASGMHGVGGAVQGPGSPDGEDLAVLTSLVFAE